MRLTLIPLVGLLGGCAAKGPTAEATGPVPPRVIERFRESGGFARQLSRGTGGPFDISLDEGFRGFRPPQPGGGKMSNAAREVAAMRAGFRTCYQRALMVTPNAQGHTRLVLRIDQDGSVVAVKALALGLPPSSVDCMLERAIAAHFQPPEGGCAVIAVPVAFLTQ